MKKLKVILLICVLASYAVGLFIARSGNNGAGEAARLKAMISVDALPRKTGLPPHYLLADGSVAFNTFDVAPSIKGYAGPIKLLVVLGRDGRIRDLSILEHGETKNYVHQMESPEYLGKLVEKHAGDPFLPEHDVDGISRATVSVKALADTLRESTATVAADILKLDIVRSGTGPGRFMVGWAAYLLFFLFSFAAYFITRKSRRPARLRDVSLAASVAITGLWLSTPFSILHVFNLALMRPSGSYLWYALVLTTAFSVLLAGRFYCGWLCPFGALSEFIGRLPVRKWAVPEALDRSRREMKYFALSAAAIIVFISGKPEYGNYEPYVTLFSLDGNYPAWPLLAAALTANLRIERFWCRYLCPVGALTGMLSKNAKGYSGGAVCPMGNRQPFSMSECIKCNRCLGGAK